MASGWVRSTVGVELGAKGRIGGGCDKYDVWDVCLTFWEAARDTHVSSVRSVAATSTIDGAVRARAVGRNQTAPTVAPWSRLVGAEGVHAALQEPGRVTTRWGHVGVRWETVRCR